MDEHKSNGDRPAAPVTWMRNPGTDEVEEVSEQYAVGFGGTIIERGAKVLVAVGK